MDLLTRLTLLVVALAALTACHDDDRAPEAAPTAPSSTAAATGEPAEEPTTTPRPEPPKFDVAAWQASWRPQRIALTRALTRLRTELDRLSAAGASREQVAEALHRLSGRIVAADEAFVATLRSVSRVPRDRPDVIKVYRQLRTALIEHSRAYAGIVECGLDPDCQEDRLGALDAAGDTLSAAFAAMPTR